MQHQTAPDQAFDMVGTLHCTGFAEGAHPRAMMERMGHSTINVTLGTYGHLFPGIDDQLNHALGTRWTRSAGTPPTQPPVRLTDRRHQ